MPIEIRELHIRMSVGAGPGGVEPASGAGSAESGARRTSDEELVTRCVEQVMDVLRNRGER